MKKIKIRLNDDEWVLFQESIPIYLEKMGNNLEDKLIQCLMLEVYQRLRKKSILNRVNTISISIAEGIALLLLANEHLITPDDYQDVVNESYSRQVIGKVTGIIHQAVV